jgi:hypothetical protein
MQHGSLANQFSDVLSYSKSGHKGDFLEYGSGSGMVKRSGKFSPNREKDEANKGLARALNYRIDRVY